MKFIEFCCQPRKRVDKVLKKLVEPNSMTEKDKKSLKPVGSRSGVMYSLCKVLAHHFDQF